MSSINMSIFSLFFFAHLKVFPVRTFFMNSHSATRYIDVYMYFATFVPTHPSFPAAKRPIILRLFWKELGKNLKPIPFKSTAIRTPLNRGQFANLSNHSFYHSSFSSASCFSSLSQRPHSSLSLSLPSFISPIRPSSSLSLSPSLPLQGSVESGTSVWGNNQQIFTVTGFYKVGWVHRQAESERL